MNCIVIMGICEQHPPCDHCPVSCVLRCPEPVCIEDREEFRRQELARIACQLRGAELSIVEISARMGVTRKMVYKYLEIARVARLCDQAI